METIRWVIEHYGIDGQTVMASFFLIFLTIVAIVGAFSKPQNRPEMNNESLKG